MPNVTEEIKYTLDKIGCGIDYEEAKGILRIITRDTTNEWSLCDKCHKPWKFHEKKDSFLICPK